MTPTTPLGSVRRDADGVRLQFVRTYDAPIADVWSAITDPQRMSRWYGTWTGDPATGTVQVLMTAEEGAQPEPVRILTCEPPSVLVVELDGPEGVWHLTASLSEAAGTTTLTFVHRLTEPYDAGSIGPGWHFYLDRLGAAIEGTEVPDDWDAYHPALEQAYAVPDAAGR